jgi:hypothetical protein
MTMMQESAGSPEGLLRSSFLLGCDGMLAISSGGAAVCSVRAGSAGRWTLDIFRSPQAN